MQPDSPAATIIEIMYGTVAVLTFPLMLYPGVQILDKALGISSSILQGVESAVQRQGAAREHSEAVRGGVGWVGLAASCRSRPSGVGFRPCPTTRLNYLTVRFQG